jgi:hypothetical protein
MYILGLSSSWGTSRIRPAWSPSEHQLAPALSPQFGARVRSHAVRRRLFIVLMIAAHISPNFFSLRNFLSNIHGLFLTIHSTSFAPIIHHIYTNNYIFYLHDTFTLSYLRIFMAGWLPSVPCVRYIQYIKSSSCGALPAGCTTLSAGESTMKCQNVLWPLPLTSPLIIHFFSSNSSEIH